MTLTERIRNALGKWAVQNATFPGQWTTFGDSVYRSSAGVAITPETAMRLSAVYRSATLISGAVATLPLPIFKRMADGSRQSAGNTDIWWLLNEAPYSGWTAASFWEYTVLSMLLRGDGFARIHPGANNRPMKLEPIRPDDVRVERQAGELVYYLNQDGKKDTVPEEYMLHFPMPGFDGLRSPSVIKYAAMQTIGTSIRTEDHTARLFESGAANRVALEVQNQVKPEVAKAMRDSWMETYGDSADTRRFPIILQGGTKATTISLSAADAQLLETRRFHVEDIARSFGVPPWMIGAMDKQSSWGSGVEQAGIGFVIYTLNPHLHRIQNELNRKLYPRNPYYVEFAVEGLMQGDSKAQSDYFRQALGGSNGPGWMSVNEVRRLKNLPPIDGGNEIYAPSGATGGNGEPAKDSSGPP